MVYFVLILFILLFFVIKKKFKSLKLGSLALITGGVKCGKSTLSVSLVVKRYKKVLRLTKISNFFRKLLKKSLLEIPLLYSNIPLSVPYVLVTRELLLRKVRARYNSVIYIQEASLVADSQLVKDNDINNMLLLFNKLIAHSGVNLLVYDTQSIADVHYSIKRSLSNYFYIHHLINIPLVPFLIAYVQEYRYSDDGSVVAITGDKDLENSLKRVFILKKTWKLFDSHCFSVLTDNLPVLDNVVKAKTLKCNEIVSFRKQFCKLSNVNLIGSKKSEIENFKNKEIKNNA